MADKNLWVAVALSAVIILVYQLMVVEPQAERRRAELEAQRALEQAQSEVLPGAANETAQTPAGFSDLGAPAADAIPGAQGAPATATPQAATTAEPAAGIIAIDAPSVRGRINLLGAQIDQLFLKNYFYTLNPDDPRADEIELLHPLDAQGSYYAVHGWLAGANGPADLPGPRTIWTADADAVLSDGDAVTLSHVSESGLVFRRTIRVDENFMFEITDEVTNRSGAPAALAPYGFINRHGVPDDLENFIILHEGLVGVLDGALTERKYKKLQNDGAVRQTTTGGWLGVTDKYWLTALVPPQDETFTGEYKVHQVAGTPVFQSLYTMSARTVAPGETISFTSHLFAGAKKVKTLRSYQKDDSLGIKDFDRAVDWGHLFFMTKPLFMVLSFFGENIGNYGIAILLLTLCIKLVMFPLANKSFESMSKMKKLQPEVQKLRERYKEDQVKMQQEMMALYRTEKLNPLAGCLPVIVQIPVFYALYKVLFVTIELRHAPFFAWIQDLSAPDPTTIFNLFGLLPYDPTAAPVIGSFLGVGVLPLIMGVGMWFQMKLNPPPTDPIQQQVFALMPFIFVFILAPFASGLVLYWTWNTLLSMAQQYAIMRRMGVEVHLGENLKPPAFVKQLLSNRGGGGDAAAKPDSANENVANGDADGDEAANDPKAPANEK